MLLTNFKIGSVVWIIEVGPINQKESSKVEEGGRRGQQQTADDVCEELNLPLLALTTEATAMSRRRQAASRS